MNQKNNLFYERKINDEINCIYNKSIKWIKKKKGKIIEEEKPNYLKVYDYRDFEGLLKANNSLEIKLDELNGYVNVAVSIPKVEVTSFMLFLKGHNCAFLEIIETYFRFIGYEFTDDDLRELFPEDYLLSFLAASILYSVIFLAFTYMGLYRIFDFYPSISFILLFLISLMMGFLATIFFKQFVRIFRKISKLY